MWQNALNLQKQTELYTKFKNISFSLKKIVENSRQDGEYMKKENSKIWSEEAIDTLFNQSHECLLNFTRGDYKDLEVIFYCKNRNYCQKNELIFEANSYKIITDKITQRRVVLAQMKCFSQLGNGISD